MYGGSAVSVSGLSATKRKNGEPLGGIATTSTSSSDA
jgi:hypothetical protein